MLNVSDAVAVFHSSGQHSEALPSDSVHDRSSIGEEVDAPDDQHAAIICKPGEDGNSELWGHCTICSWCKPTPWLLSAVSPHKLSTPYNRSPFLWIVYAHAELPRPRVHAAADHEAVARLEDVQRTRHGGIRHGTHKDRHILCQAARGETDSA